MGEALEFVSTRQLRLELPCELENLALLGAATRAMMLELGLSAESASNLEL